MVLRIALREEVPVQAAVEPMKYAPAENVYRIRIREEIREIPAAAEMFIPVSVRGVLLHNLLHALNSTVLQDNKDYKVREKGRCLLPSFLILCNHFLLSERHKKTGQITRSVFIF